MDFTMGMKCPICKVHVNFCGGQLGMIGGTMVNCNCDCGFSATLVVPQEGYDFFKLKFLKNKA